MALITSNWRATTPTKRMPDSTTRFGSKNMACTTGATTFSDPQTGQPKRHGAWDLPAEFHYTTWTAERTIASIEAATAADKPFFGWASFHDPHPPYLVPQPWASMYNPDDMEPGTLLENEMELLPEHFRLTQQAKPGFFGLSGNRIWQSWLS